MSFVPNVCQLKVKFLAWLNILMCYLSSQPITQAAESLPCKYNGKKINIDFPKIDLPSKEENPEHRNLLSPSFDNYAFNLSYKYIGNSFSQKFHRPSCPFAKVMSSQHLVLFHFRKEATEAGQIPCKYCLPPFWKTVKCQIINGANSNHIDFSSNQSDKSSLEPKESEQTKHLAQ